MLQKSVVDIMVAIGEIVDIMVCHRQDLYESPAVMDSVFDLVSYMADDVGIHDVDFVDSQAHRLIAIATDIVTQWLPVTAYQVATLNSPRRLNELYFVVSLRTS